MYEPRHAATRKRVVRARYVFPVALGAAFVTGMAWPQPASAATVQAAAPAGVPASLDVTLGQHILDIAETRIGDPYVWGGHAPGGFDCSGLVYWAAQQEGINIPRTTYGMIADPGPHLVQIPLDQVERGDILFFGTGHVEFATKDFHGSLGAQQPGTLVGYHVWGGSWAPTMAFRFQ